jgi:ATP-dependent DNA ligase
MKKHPTLYARDSIGNIRVWYMEQEEGQYRTVAGLLDGERVTSEWTLAKPKNKGKKNETNAEQQASSEVDSRYKKQRKTGYFDRKEDVDQAKYVEPMLAKLYKDYHEEIELEEGEWLMQCKLNGMRCVATKDGLFTRKGERYVSCPHIEEALRPFFNEHPTAVLDGELFNNDLRQRLNEISKLIRKTVHITDEDLKRSKELVHYYIYDGYGFGLDKDHPYHERKQWIDSNVIGHYTHVAKVKDVPVLSKDDLNKHYEAFVEEGHEGAILRHRGMKYEHKRSRNLLKVKPEMDSEAKILKVIEGSGNWGGTAKTATLDWDGKVFDATFKGTQEQLRDVLKKKSDWIGRTVTFLYNDTTGLGTPNFARIDGDNCFKDDR